MKNEKKRKTKTQKKRVSKKEASKVANRAASQTPRINKTGSAGAGKNRSGKEIQKSNEIKKVRTNDFKTGKLIWIPENKLKAYAKKSKAYKEKKEKVKAKEEIKKISKFLDVPEKKVSQNLYDNINSFDKLNRLLKREKRLRYKGKFISSDAQNDIIKYAKFFDSQGVEWTLTDLLNTPQLQQKIIVIDNIKQNAPSYMFYYLLETYVTNEKFGQTEKETKRSKDLGVFKKDEIIFEILDFNNKIIYKGKDRTEAIQTINKINKKIQKIEDVIEIKESTNPYFTVPVYDVTRDTEIIKIKINYSGIESRLPRELHEKYKSML